MNAKWFGKQNPENQDGSGKNTVFSHWSACTQDPVHLRTQILAWALKPDLLHHSSTPHLKHTIVFSVTLWSLLLRSLAFTTYSTGGFAGKAVCEASSALSRPFFLHKDALFIPLSIPDVLVILCCRPLMSNNPIGNFRSCFLGGHRLYCVLLERHCKNNCGGSQTLVNKIKFCRKASFAWPDFL